MGLYVQSLDSLPSEQHRDYYVYLLDYGWDKPLGEALFKNLDRMTEIAEKSNAVVIHSSNRVHFADQVLSWHNVNGEDAKEMLPAILITNRNPHRFKECKSKDNRRIEEDLKLIFIPLDKFCNNPSDVVGLIERLFADIKAGKQLTEFRVGKKVRKGGRALADALVLEPAANNKSITMSDVIKFLQGESGDISLKSGLAKTTHPIHFEDFSGEQFEWLVFAFIKRQKAWQNLEWLGQTGGDEGRDIWGVFNGESYCYQCANYQKLTAKKGKDDIDKLIKNNRKPDYVIVVCGGVATPGIREQVLNYSASKGIKQTEVWSGREFEERLRHYTPDLIQRFVEGESFPEGNYGAVLKDESEIVLKLFECFDRPAFTTHFRSEVSIPDFEKAITDTIEVLNTGVHRLRDGTIIRKISSRHEVKNSEAKSKLDVLTKQVVALRDKFVKLKRQNEIRPCGCDNKDCATWFFSDKAAREMDESRKLIHKQLRSINPNFVLNYH